MAEASNLSKVSAGVDKAKALVEELKKNKGFWGIVQEFLFGPYQKCISNLTAFCMLTLALIIDLLIQPLLDIIAIGVLASIMAVCIFIPWFVIVGYDWKTKIKEKLISIITGAVIEGVPYLDLLPGVSGVVGYNIWQMRMEDWQKWKEEEERKKEEAREQMERMHAEQARQAEEVATQENTEDEQSGAQSVVQNRQFKNVAEPGGYTMADEVRPRGNIRRNNYWGTSGSGG